MSKKPARPSNAFKSNLYNSNMLFFMEGLDCEINDSMTKKSRWPIGSWSNKMDIHLYIFSIKCSVISMSSSHLYNAILHLISIWFLRCFLLDIDLIFILEIWAASFYELVNQNLWLHCNETSPTKEALVAVYLQSAFVILFNVNWINMLFPPVSIWFHFTVYYDKHYSRHKQTIQTAPCWFLKILNSYGT